MMPSTPIKKNELVDIRDITINPSDSVDHRVESLMTQIKNPYCFKHGDMVVRVQFQGDTSLEDKIVNHYKNDESIHS